MKQKVSMLYSNHKAIKTLLTLENLKISSNLQHAKQQTITSVSEAIVKWFNDFR